MKKTLCILCLLALLTPAAIALYRRCTAERVFVIISTNDVHSHLENIPRLATALAACRDTVACVVADAGDRWTGDVFVDMAPEPRKPIIDLMNDLGYDVATFGNHEFDSGRDFLARMIPQYGFHVVCSNVRSTDGKFPEIDPYTIMNIGGVKVGFAGVVTNFADGHPEGDAASFVGLEFPDTYESALAASRNMKRKCDVRVLVSHMGFLRDSIFAAEHKGAYDFIISGHTHQFVDTLVNGTVIGQTFRYLPAVGAATVKMRGRRLVSIDYRIVPLDGYDPDPEFQARIDKIYENPYLNEKMGYNAVELDKVGLADMFTSIAKTAAGTDIGMYHIGGVRLAGLPVDSISRATLINADIFISHLRTADMTVEQMRKLIIDKFNDSSSEGGHLDIFMTEPYTLYADSSDRAYAVEFPTLDENRTYSVALSDYMAKNYKGFEGENIVDRKDLVVTELFIDHFNNHSPVRFSNVQRNFLVSAKNMKTE